MRYPIYFICSGTGGWPDLLHPSDPPDPDEPSSVERINTVGGAFGWTVQTYLRLKRRGHDVRLRKRFVPGALCVAHYDHIAIRSLPLRSFIAAIQPDRPRAHLCELRLVQNERCIERPATDLLIPYWPQPGLRPRDPGRGSRVERVGFVGRPIYLAPPFRSESFRRELAALGMELVIKDKAWYDYADLDAILAVRDVTEYDLSLKPASKLVNAWHGETPALLGPEPAYHTLRRSDLDYLEVATPDQALEALRRLKREPDLFHAMVENGRKRRGEFTAEAIARQWERLLTGPVTEAYEQWRRTPDFLRTPRLLAQFPLRALRHKQARRRFRRMI